MKIKITEVQILPIKPRDGLVAFASLVLNDSIFIGSIGIHKKLSTEGYRLTYPTKKVGQLNLNIYHPITPELSRSIESAVVEKFKNVMKKVNDRYCGA